MNSLVSDLLKFLDASPTPYHAVENVKVALQQSGFTALHESASWNLVKAGRYYIERRNASIIAFKIGQSELCDTGLRIIGAHTDSPTLKVKPNPVTQSYSYCQLGIEVYGGVLMNPWFDRDLSIAGRITFERDEALCHSLINFKRPIAIIPSLAIHMDRNVNAGREINPQTHMKPILLQAEQAMSLKQLLAEEFKRTGIELDADTILEHDLCFYDTQPASVLGLNSDFIASARLDNLLSCFLGLRALIESDDHTGAMLALYDHEEVGSTSAVGANSNMLTSLLERLCPNAEDRHRTLAKSVMLSVDNAHGIHPNYANKHDEGHAPLLNRGPVIKVDANQSYATTSETAGLVRWLAKKANTPVQSYVTRADMRCGSTIGPMSSAKTGIRSVDMGVATFAMHSVRETAGVKDAEYLGAILKTYLNTPTFSF